MSTKVKIWDSVYYPWKIIIILAISSLKIKKNGNLGLKVFNWQILYCRELCHSLPETIHLDLRWNLMESDEHKIVDIRITSSQNVCNL